MSSNRVQAVRYSLKGSSQPKTRSLKSTSGDLFDKLKSSVASKAAPTTAALPEHSESENHQGRSTDSYSHSPRSQVKVSGSPFDPSITPPSVESVDLSPASGPASDDENMHGIEVAPKKENSKKKDLAVFDFDLSGDEDDVSQVRRGVKKTKVNHRGSHHSKQSVTSKKQTLLHQYMGVQSASSSSGRGVSKKNNDSKDVRAVKSNAKKQIPASQTATDRGVRNTISKLLASKAEELAAKASTQERQRGYTSQVGSASTTSAMSLDKIAAPVSEETGGLINRRTKRRNPLATSAAAAKRAPPKRAKMEREEDTEVMVLDSMSLQASASSIPSVQQPESSQTRQSDAKKNGLKGTLEKSEIALRTRSSRKTQGCDTRSQEADQKAEIPDSITLSDSQPSSLTESDTYSPLHQEPELGLTDSPRSSVSSSSEVSRGGRPSPRYTARGRRLSNLSPDVKLDQASRALSAVSGLGMGMRPALVKHSGEGELESDPYSLDSEIDKAYLKKQHLIPPKPSLKKSSSATAYSLTTPLTTDAQPPSSSKAKLKAVPIGQSSQPGPSTVDRRDIRSIRPSMPALTKSSSWPSRLPVAGRTTAGESSHLAGSQRLVPKGSSHAGSSTAAVGIACPKDEKQLYTVIRNVRQAHECLEIGESQQFFDEVHYLLDSIKPSQPLSVRCLGAFNLSTHYFDPEFSRQLRAHSFTPKITALLKDCLQHPTLCLSAAVLFYVMTRDKLNTEWDDNGAALLVGMLSKEESFFTSELTTGKAQREMTRLRVKAKGILQKVQEQSSLSPSSSQSVASDDDPPAPTIRVEGVSGGEGRDKGDILKEKPHLVNTDSISVQELACECLISLTHHQHNPQWLRHQLRLLGGLDILANLVISSIDDISSVDVRAFSQTSQTTTNDYATGISNRLVALERRLKALEHATIRNKDNQSYVVVFDGSILLSKIISLVTSFQNFMKHDSLRCLSENCLLTVFKVLLNLTHEFQLGCYRLGEQRGVMSILLSVLFQLSETMSDEDSAFDVTVLTLSLLINLTEMCDGNRSLLEATKLPWIENTSSGSQDHVIDDAIYGSDSSIRALVLLFLKRFSKAESTQIQVPTPQRLSQLPSSSPAQPTHQNSQPQELQPTSKRDLLASFTSRMQKATSVQNSSQKESSQSSQSSSELTQGDGLKWLDEDPVPSETKRDEGMVAGDGTESDDEEEEALEKVEIDPLVFSREEFDAALHQAGRHMEDSVIAAYSALLLGILSKHNQDTLKYVRNSMPSQSFSEMIDILKKLVSFMNMTGSATGLDSIRNIVKFLENL